MRGEEALILHRTRQDAVVLTLRSVTVAAPGWRRAPLPLAPLLAAAGVPTTLPARAPLTPAGAVTATSPDPRQRIGARRALGWSGR
ncbi:hypothetical protein [Brachybacterium sp. GPGPB12]|uniref:hypothetical protein n=1 Tax=Brachybacterium sp. GPGPB12 TaxID=3023517 RepID=UPI00313446DC